MATDTTYFSIPESNWKAAEDKLKKLAKKAKKTGTDFQFSWVGDFSIEVKHRGLPFSVSYGVLEVSSGRIKLSKGHTFIATVTPQESGFNLLKKTPAGEKVEIPAEFRDAAPRCDHCNTQRQRKEMFLVAGPDGSIKAVGRNCLSDYLGVDPTVAMHWFTLTGDIAVLGDLSEYEASSGWCRGLSLDLHTFVALVFCSARTYGWVSGAEARQQDKCSTADLVTDFATAKEGSSILKHFPHEISDKDWEEAAAALEWASKEFTAESNTDYAYNMFVALQGQVKRDTKGLAASLYIAFRRFQEREIERASAPEICNEHFGKITDTKILKSGKNKGQTKEFKPRYELTLTIERIRCIDGDYGATVIHTMLDEDGRQFVWFGSHILEDESVGATFTATWSIKKHDEFKGRKQTVLLRPTLKVKETA